LTDAEPHITVAGEEGGGFGSVIASASVTWIRVEHPTFDLAGVLMSSMQIAGGLLVGALVFGVVFGLGLIWRRRRQGLTRLERIVLHLGAR
jgi:hypothetical protein